MFHATSSNVLKRSGRRIALRTAALGSVLFLAGCLQGPMATESTPDQGVVVADIAVQAAEE
ncbi:hypothetical protein SAMN05421759_1059 [Roseivivax lentus]|uniref:Uncharacterized protein n=1 Tax=Roseivivax lentus TaxID=633194 RepID=A0A1N7MN14_9RHOB|nr:hypothetical protein [Roseivivax lentus]SIS87341.1 hypothetical protein SAMN05421759_1059 [Roseivivax lentus]